MRLGNLLDMQELANHIVTGHIYFRRHPSLPLAILNYTNECMFNNYWPDVVQKCRGLVINTTEWDRGNPPDSDVVSRPYHKFFNLNQQSQPETLEVNLPKVEPSVTEKMDGWFGIQWQCGEQYGVASRGSFDSIGARFATQKLQKLVKYGAVEEFPKGYTPIYEIIAKDCKIVVDYPFEGLVLLGCVNNMTGEELPYDELQAVWAKIAGYSADNRPWIRLVKAHRMSVDDCLTSPKTNFEGFVLSYPRPGTWPIKVKVKLEDYKRLHKLITGITPQQIWRALHDPMAPWLGGEVPDHFRQWALKWRDELYVLFHAGMRQTLTALDDLSEMPGLSLDVIDRANRRRVFDILNASNPQYATVVMNILDGKIYEAHQAIWNSIRPVGRESDTFYREGQGE